jgi:hypothetical protein
MPCSTTSGSRGHYIVGAIPARARCRRELWIRHPRCHPHLADGFTEAVISITASSRAGFRAMRAFQVTIARSIALRCRAHRAHQAMLKSEGGAAIAAMSGRAEIRQRAAPEAVRAGSFVPLDCLPVFETSGSR